MDGLVGNSLGRRLEASGGTAVQEVAGEGWMVAVRWLSGAVRPRSANSDTVSRSVDVGIDSIRPFLSSSTAAEGRQIAGIECKE